MFINSGTISKSIEGENGLEAIQELTLEGLLNTNKIVTQELETNVLTINDDVTIKDDGGDVNASSVGSATIEAGDTDIIIETISVTDSAQVFVTAKTYLEQPLYISEILNEESFTVSIANALDEDIEFSWFIITN
jgi:archaellum component FlaF (FlaF/FlaG flagellin family)